METVSQTEARKAAKKYLRQDNPVASALATEIERKHNEITSTKLISLNDYRLYVDPGVFNPEFSFMGQLLAESIEVQADDFVFDLGTGTGFQAIVASARARQVLAVDKQREAVECARKNVELNGLQGKIEVRQGDLFSPVKEGEIFDMILSNFPFVPWEPETRWQEANFDAGHQLLGKFLEQAKSRLKPGGRIGMTWSDLGDTLYFHSRLEAEGYAYKVLVTRMIKDVGQYIYELSSSI